LLTPHPSPFSCHLLLSRPQHFTIEYLQGGGKEGEKRNEKERAIRFGFFGRWEGFEDRADVLSPLIEKLKVPSLLVLLVLLLLLLLLLLLFLLLRLLMLLLLLLLLLPADCDCRYYLVAGRLPLIYFLLMAFSFLFSRIVFLISMMQKASKGISQVTLELRIGHARKLFGPAKTGEPFLLLSSSSSSFCLLLIPPLLLQIYSL